MASSQYGQGLRLNLQVFVEMLPCAILVGRTLSHDTQLSIFYALVQYARCRVFECVEVKDGSLDTFRGWLVSEPVYWTELDCEATLVFGERPSAPILR